MESKPSNPTLLPCLPSNELQGENEVKFFDFTLLQKESEVPKEFIWPSEYWVKSSGEELDLPLIDIGAIKGDEAAMVAAAEIVREACIKHGAFLVTNHCVDSNLISDIYQQTDHIFKLPLSKKLSAQTTDSGFSVAHAERYSSVLPWKETFTFLYKHNHESQNQVVDFLKSLLGEDFQQTAFVFQKYSDGMKELSEIILELLAISLGVDRKHYQKFFEDAESIMRCNFYPPCSASLTGALGSGPHCDPTAITILLQDEVRGLEVCVDDKWLVLPPRPNTFVINIGDTFMALTNGIYKSCLHRVLVNKQLERKSLTFFLCPKGDKTISPPNDLLGKEESRNYPDFKWSDVYEFTQKRRRVDATTLDSFISWRQSSETSSS